MTQAKHQPDCARCGAPADVSFKDTANDSMTWIFLQCDSCEEEFCAACCSTTDPADANCDTNTCVGCMLDL